MIMATQLSRDQFLALKPNITAQLESLHFQPPDYQKQLLMQTGLQHCLAIAWETMGHAGKNLQEAC